MVETRSTARGAPLKKPGAYNTDLYYQEKDEGFGDVGVNQEPDAGARDDTADPTFEPGEADLKAADEAAQREDAEMPVEGDVKAEVEDLTKPATTGEPERGPDGEPVPVVEGVLPGEQDIVPEEGRDTE